MRIHSISASVGERIGWEGMRIPRIAPAWSWMDSFTEQSFKEMAERGVY